MRPWWRSQKIMVLLILVTIVTTGIVVIVCTGHLVVSEALVRDYLYAIVGLGGSAILGRAWEGAQNRR